eukprot:1154291-Pelagomonas_calceolata.AAC.7
MHCLCGRASAALPGWAGLDVGEMIICEQAWPKMCPHHIPYDQLHQILSRTKYWSRTSNKEFGWLFATISEHLQARGVTTTPAQSLPGAPAERPAGPSHITPGNTVLVKIAADTPLSHHTWYHCAAGAAPSCTGMRHGLSTACCSGVSTALAPVARLPEVMEVGRARAPIVGELECAGTCGSGQSKYEAAFSLSF